MDTRLILQIVLGVIVALIAVMGVVLIITLTKDADTVIVDQIADDDDGEEAESPWAGQGDAAIGLVRRVDVASDPDVEGVDAETVGDLIEDEDFVDQMLHVGSAEPEGWEVEWWGETRYGPSFYRVRYGFRDAEVTLGPTWLVDLVSQQVVPMNVLAKVVTDPEQGVESEYFDKADQVVSAMINHRFATGINLGGAILAYFDQRLEADEDDEVLGWTVSHRRDELFRAYFQWTDGEERTYAEFEFDFDERALRPVNLQASEIMRVGEDFDPTDRGRIMPKSYDPDELIPANRWQGPARRSCRSGSMRETCQSLATILDNGGLIETLEWTLTTNADSADAFRRCQTPQTGEDRPRCRWTANEEDDQVYVVDYVYDLGDGEERISWTVDLEEETVVPVDEFSKLAYWAVNPRH